MSIEVKIFGQLAEIIGSDNLLLDDVKDSDELREILLRNFPGLKEYKFAVAVGKKIVNSKHKILDGDEIALLPPFSGG